MTEKIKYIFSTLPGSVRLVDGTLVIFVHPDDEIGGANVPINDPSVPPTLSESK